MDSALGGPLATVGFLEYTFMVSGLAAFARRALLGADALHLEAAADGACPTRRLRRGIMDETENTDREPRVGFALTSSFSADVLGPSPSSCLVFFRLSSVIEDEGRLPLTLVPCSEYCSIGGVPMVSEPCEDGEERLAVMR